MSQRLQIELSSQDPEIVDGVAKKIVRFIKDRHPHTPVAIPLPARSKQSDDEASDRIHPRAVKVRAVDTDLIVDMRQLNLPEGVEITIKQPD